MICLRISDGGASPDVFSSPSEANVVGLIGWNSARDSVNNIAPCVVLGLRHIVTHGGAAHPLVSTRLTAPRQVMFSWKTCVHLSASSCGRLCLGIKNLFSFRLTTPRQVINILHR